MFAQSLRELKMDVAIIDAEADNLTLTQTVKEAVKLNPLEVVISVNGITPSVSSTPKMPLASKLASLLKERNYKVYMAGLHPSALPVETLTSNKIDGVLRGTLFDYCQPAWDLLPMDKYRAHNWHCLQDIDNRGHYASIYTSFGCPYRCSYCNIHALYGVQRGIKYFDLNDVIKTIDTLVNVYEVYNLKIADELFAFREDRVCQLCRMIIDRGYKLNIWAYARVDTITERMLEYMKLAGFNWIGYGFESSVGKVRSGVGKIYNTDAELRAIELTRRYGINIMANYIFGLPYDDAETMRATLDEAEQNNFEFVNFYTAIAYPGSKLYTEAIRRGVPLPDTWDAYGQFSPNCQPLGTRDLSPKQVVEFRDNAFIEYFNRKEYQDMVQKKFGDKALKHIKDMLKIKIKRT